MFSTGDAISATVYNNGYWARLIIDISVAFCAGIEAPFVLDIGANLGAYAIPLAQKIAAANGTIFAFEPQRIVCYQLCGNVILNRLDNVQVFQTAIGAADEVISIPNVDYARSANIGGFSLDPTLNGRGAIAEAGGTVDVTMMKLDSIPLARVPALIKIDVEGAELDVLKGAERTIRESNFPPLLLEAWTNDWFVERREALLRYLSSVGYVWFLIGDEVVAQNPAHGRQFEFRQDADAGLRMIRVR